MALVDLLEQAGEYLLGQQALLLNGTAKLGIALSFVGLKLAGYIHLAVDILYLGYCCRVLLTIICLQESTPTDAGNCEQVVVVVVLVVEVLPVPAVGPWVQQL